MGARNCEPRHDPGARRPGSGPRMRCYIVRGGPAMPRADITRIDRSRQPAWRRAALAALLVLGSSGSMLAAVPARAADPSADAGRPERGARMTAIEARYGAPAERYPAVGR